MSCQAKHSTTWQETHCAYQPSGIFSVDILVLGTRSKFLLQILIAPVDQPNLVFYSSWVVFIDVPLLAPGCPCSVKLSLAPPGTQQGSVWNIMKCPRDCAVVLPGAEGLSDLCDCLGWWREAEKRDVDRNERKNAWGISLCALQWWEQLSISFDIYLTVKH